MPMQESQQHLWLVLNMIGGKQTGDITLKPEKAKEIIANLKNIPSKMRIMTDVYTYKYSNS